MNSKPPPLPKPPGRDVTIRTLEPERKCLHATCSAGAPASSTKPSQVALFQNVHGSTVSKHLACPRTCSECLRRFGKPAREAFVRNAADEAGVVLPDEPLPFVEDAREMPRGTSAASRLPTPPSATGLGRVSIAPAARVVEVLLLREEVGGATASSCFEPAR
jgi:hypothetical protein